MKRKFLVGFFVISILMAAAIMGKPFWQAVYQYCHEITEKQERSVYGKGIRQDMVKKELAAGTNLDELAKEEENKKQYIEDCIAEMSLEEKLAQMMILTNEKDITKQNMETYQPGGIIFFGVDFNGRTIQEVRKRVDDLQSYVKIPLFIGVDEEGGEVSRVAGLKESGLPAFKNARELYKQRENDKVRQETIVKIELLEAMGINLNFDPVADVVSEPNAYMYDRAAGSTAEQVAEYVETVVTVMQEYNMGSCLKHFPGYGNNVNTHAAYAADNREQELYEEKDFIPFQAGISKGADMVMVSHIVMTAVDKEHPSSLSWKVHELLRENLDFQGVIIADDLNMKAILNTMTIKEATAEAFLAGNDMVFSADFTASMTGAKEAAVNGELTEQQINASVARILRMKMNRGLILMEE